MKKYILTDETTQIANRTLYRIKAIKDFGNVKSGDLGGWIEKEENLSHDGTCWVYNNAKVFCDAEVFDDAKVFGDAKVYDNAEVFGDAVVFENARISENAHIFGYAGIFGHAGISGHVRVFNNAEVFGDSWIYGNAQIYGNARVFGHIEIFGNAVVSNNALISSNSDYLTIGPIGSRRDTTTFYRTKNDIWVCCGCFNDSISVFKERVQEVHKGTRYEKEYLVAIDCALSHFDS